MPFKVQCGRCLAVFQAPAQTPTQAPTRAEPAPEQPTGTVLSEPPTAASVGPAGPESRPVWARQTRSRIAVAVLALTVVAAVALYRRGIPREARAAIQEGREKLLLDDTQSLQEATRLFTDALRDAPGQAEAEAERALALLLQASARMDLAARLPAAERPEHERAASKLLQDGSARQAMADDASSPAALRTMALAEALSGTAGPAAARAEEAERAAPGEPWVLYAKAVAAAAG